MKKALETIPAWMMVLCIFWGCLRSTRDVESFLREYRISAESETIRGGYRVTTFLANPEYLAGMRLRRPLDSDHKEFERLKSQFSTSHYLNLTVGPDSVTAFQGGSVDVLNSEAAKGRRAFFERLSLLQNGMSALCFLELSTGERVFPSAYSFDRGWGFQSQVSFLFAFPKTWNGKPLHIQNAKVVIKDFGLNIGNIRHDVKRPLGPKLKV